MVNGNFVFAIGMYDFGASSGPKRHPFANFCAETMCVPVSFSYTCSPCGIDDRERFSVDVSFTWKCKTMSIIAEENRLLNVLFVLFMSQKKKLWWIKDILLNSFWICFDFWLHSSTKRTKVASSKTVESKLNRHVSGAEMDETGDRRENERETFEREALDQAPFLITVLINDSQ